MISWLRIGLILLLCLSVSGTQCLAACVEKACQKAGDIAEQQQKPPCHRSAPEQSPVSHDQSSPAKNDCSHEGLAIKTADSSPDLGGAQTTQWFLVTAEQIGTLGHFRISAPSQNIVLPQGRGGAILVLRI